VKSRRSARLNYRAAASRACPALLQSSLRRSCSMVASRRVALLFVDLRYTIHGRDGARVRICNIQPSSARSRQHDRRGRCDSLRTPYRPPAADRRRKEWDDDDLRFDAGESITEARRNQRSTEARHATGRNAKPVKFARVYYRASVPFPPFQLARARSRCFCMAFELRHQCSTQLAPISPVRRAPSIGCRAEAALRRTRRRGFRSSWKTPAT